MAGLKKPRKSLEEIIGKSPPEDRPLESKSQTAVQTPIHSQPAKPKPKSTISKPIKPAKVIKPVKFSTEVKQSDDAVKITLRLPIIEKGVSKTYDAILEVTDKKKAFRAFLKKALTHFEAHLLSGENLPPPDDYQNTGEMFQTTRLFDEGAFAVAKAAYDPADIETHFMNSNNVGKAAIQSYIAQEK